MKQTNKDGGAKRIIWMLLTVFCVAGCVACLIVMIRDRRSREEAETVYEAMQQNTVEDLVATEMDTENESNQLLDLGIVLPDKKIDFDALSEENADIYAWVYVPETEVDYPVLQHPTDDSYYLNHNLDGSSGYPGCIYSESLNAKDFTDNHTAFYGHNMRDGSMFASLHEFGDEEFFAGDHYIYVYTPEKVFVYRVFAAYEYAAIHLLKSFNMEDDTFFAMYLESIDGDMPGRVVNVQEDIVVTAEDRILTLSTCTTDHEDSLRFLVQGVLVYEGE